MDILSGGWPEMSFWERTDRAWRNIAYVTIDYGRIGCTLEDGEIILKWDSPPNRLDWRAFKEAMARQGILRATMDPSEIRKSIAKAFL